MRHVWCGIISLALVSCVSSEQATEPVIQAAAGGKPGLTVTSTDPNYGHQGESQKQVAIFGTGFEPGSTAEWLLDGTPDPKIQVHSTQFVSSSKVIATISIAPDATVSFYSIAITTPGRKSGIGTLIFEVTQATATVGTSLLRGVNDNGEMAGVGPVYWSPSAGLQLIASAGSAWDISDDGLTLVGGSAPENSTTGNTAVSWTRSGPLWTQTELPRDALASAGHATSVASDPSSGAAIAIGGHENYSGKKGTGSRQARLWLRNGATWQRVNLPGTTSDFVNDLNANLVAVGYVSTGVAVWEPNGSGSWNLTVIDPASTVGPKFAEARAVNRAGTIIVGTLNGDAVYWQRTSSGWSSANMLPGGCLAATGIDDFGWILLRSCSLGPSWRTFTSAVVSPPYDASAITWLGGFGNRDDGPQAWAISSQGTWIVGSAKLGNSAIGAYWQIF